ncbi:MAG: hypothetical protein PUH29_04680 [Lachnospiraceae bacterium]|nr:hypothetical protein [Lachnospiraceae bacterium]
MKMTKKLVAVLLAVMLMAPMAVSAAAPSPSKSSINGQVAKSEVTYNGKSQLPGSLVIGGKKLYLNKDFVIDKKYAAKNSDCYKIKIKGIGKYTGEATVYFTIKKKAQTIKTKVSSKSYKASKLKKAGKSFELKTKATSSKITYKVTGKNAKKYIKVSKKGKVTIKKGIKKGTYKIQITAKATKNYQSATKTIKIVIK